MVDINPQYLAIIFKNLVFGRILKVITVHSYFASPGNIDGQYSMILDSLNRA